MRKPVVSAPHPAPFLRTVPFHSPEAVSTLLTDRQREQLTRIGSRLRLPARMVIYRDETPARWIFLVAEGTVKTYRDLPSGKKVISAFLFPGDLFGLSEKGRYVNCAQAVTRVTLYRLPLDELTALLKHDADLQFQFLVKVTHALRESHRRAILVGRRDAAGRLAMFITAMRDLQPRSDSDVVLPMTRSDISSFLGVSLETVSRASAELERRGIVRFEGRHLVRVLDAKRLAKLSADV